MRPPLLRASVGHGGSFKGFGFSRSPLLRFLLRHGSPFRNTIGGVSIGASCLLRGGQPQWIRKEVSAGSRFVSRGPFLGEILGSGFGFKAICPDLGGFFVFERLFVGGAGGLKIYGLFLWVLLAVLG